jgi:hypothetical protein
LWWWLLNNRSNRFGFYNWFDIINHSFLLNLIQILLLVIQQFLFTFLFSLFTFWFCYNFAFAFVFVITKIRVFDIFSTICTFIRLRPTNVSVFINIIKTYAFVAEFTILWLFRTTQLMIIKDVFHRRKPALLTFDFLMFFCVMAFFVWLCNTLVTSFAFIILPWTSNIMHFESRNFNLFAAYGTQFCF